VAPADSRPAEAAAWEGVPGLTLRSYLVRADDSLSEIAHHFGIDLDTLISFNGIRDVSDLREGVALSIPSAAGLVYSVRSGDTLSEIADRHGVDLTELIERNGLLSSALGVGQKLFIPGASLPANVRNAVLGRLFLKPVPGRVVTPFGYQADPVTGIRRFHDGIEIENAVGTPVAASMAGTVGRVGVNGNYGRYLVLVHADGYQTLYARLSQANVQAGALVAQSQVIGAMGPAQDGEDSRLHFAIFKAGEPVDPSRYLH
jgi:murein DD-endopeptidase MepM/ murein hydrolase activator NlpD